MFLSVGRYAIVVVPVIHGAALRTYHSVPVPPTLMVGTVELYRAKKVGTNSWLYLNPDTDRLFVPNGTPVFASSNPTVASGVASWEVTIEGRTVTVRCQVNTVVQALKGDADATVYLLWRFARAIEGELGTMVVPSVYAGDGRVKCAVCGAVIGGRALSLHYRDAHGLDYSECARLRLYHRGVPSVRLVYPDGDNKLLARLGLTGGSCNRRETGPGPSLSGELAEVLVFTDDTSEVPPALVTGGVEARKNFSHDGEALYLGEKIPAAAVASRIKLLPAFPFKTNGTVAWKPQIPGVGVVTAGRELLVAAVSGDAVAVNELLLRFSDALTAAGLRCHVRAYKPENRRLTPAERRCPRCEFKGKHTLVRSHINRVHASPARDAACTVEYDTEEKRVLIYFTSSSSKSGRVLAVLRLRILRSPKGHNYEEVVS